MVNWSHLEDAFLAQLVRRDLQDHRERLDDKHSADEWQQQLLFDHDRDGADRSAKRKRTYVTHENLSGMGVIPEKADRCSDHGAAKNGQLADLRHSWKLEVSRKSCMAADVGEHGERAGSNHGAPNRQPVQAVG